MHKKPSNKNTFEYNVCNTLGFEYDYFNIKLDNKIIKLEVWDTCGKEIYHSLLSNFYRNISLAILVYAKNE